MPTGSGKTGLMMALSFGFKARRVLVISPARVLRRQVATQFKTLEVLRQSSSLKLGRRAEPKVVSLETEIRTDAQWRRYESCDVVTATTRTTSPQLQNVTPPPRDFFDLVFIDEAHHEPAETWRALVDSFDKNNTKVVLLTGTPYRRDHLPIGGRLSFMYPISRALKDGIYATVTFVSAGDPARARRDAELARRGVQQLTRLRRSGAPLILIKTDRVVHADDLAKLYRAQGLRIEAIHSDQSDAKNQENVEAARAGTLDGLVVVGMLGEGLDIPEFKVAVFHRNPQSLPYTLQLIGRLARVPPGLKHGVVVACSSDFTTETFRLYEGNEDWLQLIPQLEQQLIGPAQLRSRHSVEDSGAEIELADARPFFAVSAANRTSSIRKASLIGSIFRTAKGQASVLIDEKLDSDFRVVVTVANERPDWLQSRGVSSVADTTYDLHCFYSGKKNLMICQTTDDALAKNIQAKLFSSTKVPPYQLGKVLSVQDGTYSVIGLQNSAALSSLTPSYKMLMGTEAELAITNADRNSSTPGHGLMKLGNVANAEWRGVAFKNSKVWSLRRSGLGNLRVWMRGIESALLGGGGAVLPKLTLLRRSVPLDEFPAAPIAALWPPALFAQRITWYHANQTIKGLPAIEVESPWTKGAGNLHIDEVNVDVRASVANAYLGFAPVSASDWTITADHGETSKYSLKEFLEEFPPTLLFPDGSSVSDRLYSKPSAEPVIDYSRFKEQQWNGYLITKEIPDGANPRSIHEFVREQLALHGGSVVIYDHGTREVADYIEFNTVNCSVSFYHCKGSGGPNPGTRQHDFEELIAQGMACLRRVRSAGLIPRIEERMQNSGSQVVQGAAAGWQAAKNAFEPTEWTFRLALVQPGLSLAKLKTNAGAVLRPLLASAADYAQTSGAVLDVWCSN
jgi:superfamily II DNA or RNA helicase